MAYISLDIETVPLVIEDDTVKAYLMDKKISKYQRSFHPLFSRIIVICVKELESTTEVYHNDDEKLLLEQFWRRFGELKSPKIITFNGYNFDIPFLITRSIINDVSIPFQINTNKWQMEKSNHFDVMRFFSSHETFLNISLRTISKILEIKNGGQNGTAGSDIERLYKAGNIDAIKEKCKYDVELLEKVFEKSCRRYLEKWFPALQVFNQYNYS